MASTGHAPTSKLEKRVDASATPTSTLHIGLSLSYLANKAESEMQGGGDKIVGQGPGTEPPPPKPSRQGADENGPQDLHHDVISSTTAAQHHSASTADEDAVMNAGPSNAGCQSHSRLNATSSHTSAPRPDDAQPHHESSSSALATGEQATLQDASAPPAQTAPPDAPEDPSVSSSNLAPVLSAAASATTDPQASARERRRVATLAMRLLSELSCPVCDETLDEPVTLPCGHSACMSCLTRAAVGPALTESADAADDASPSAAHLPPRLPLSAMCVPCVVSRCPRSAIGRGLGVWSGHRAVFGSTTTSHRRRNERKMPPGAPGQTPVDGFVAASHDSNVRLRVIAPQRRQQADKNYAVAPGSDAFEIYEATTPRSWLRPDVTLCKTIQVLKAVAAQNSSSLPQPKRTGDSGAARATRTSLLRARRRLPRAGPGPGSSSFARQAAARARGAMPARANAQARATHTAAEPPLQSDQVTLDPDEEQDLEERRLRLEERRHATMDAAASDWEAEDEDDLDDEEIGGAFSRLRPETDGSEDEDASEEDMVARDRDAVDSAAPVSSGATSAASRMLKARRAARTPRRRQGVLGAPRAVTSAVVADVHSHDSEGWDTDASTSVTSRSRETSTDFDSGRAMKALAIDTSASKTAAAAVAAASIVGGPERNVTADGLHAELCDVLECQLCYLMLFEPLTTPCGHTFCRPCFARSLDHSSTCPLCRAPMPSFSFFQEHPSNKALMSLLQFEENAPDPEEDSKAMDTRPEWAEASAPWGFSKIYADRRSAVEAEERDARLSTPVFVCTLAFPSMPTILHIFEPRYRLMIRRCLESGSPRFGMVMPSRDTTGPIAGLNEYGTLLDIKSVQMLPDGRSLIETVGSARFRLLEKGSLDGYTVGRIETIDDASPDEEAALERAVLERNRSLGQGPEAPANRALAQLYATLAPGVELGLDADAAEPTTQQLIDTCVSFIHTLRSGSAPWLVTRLNHTYGPMPEASEVDRLGYWMALVMPIDEHEKAKLLPIRSPRLRLRLVVHWIEQLRQSWWFSSGCSVQ